MENMIEEIILVFTEFYGVRILRKANNFCLIWFFRTFRIPMLGFDVLSKQWKHRHWWKLLDQYIAVSNETCGYKETTVRILRWRNVENISWSFFTIRIPMESGIQKVLKWIRHLQKLVFQLGPRMKKINCVVT